MPDTCTLELGLNGLDLDAVGLPTRLQVYARVQGSCGRVRLAVRQHQGGAVLFSSEVTPDSNGTCAANFPLPTAIFPCDFRLWVEADCVSGGACARGEMVAIACKRQPGSGPGGQGPQQPGGPGGGGGGGGDDDWPWGLPPLLFCPLMGRTFTIALLLGLITLVTGVAFGNTAAIAAGGAIIAGAFAILAVWSHWCNISYCNLWGAVLWALKRTVVAGVILAFVAGSVPVFLLALAMGAAAGIITAKLRALRCRLPGLTTSLQQLPLW